MRAAGWGIVFAIECVVLNLLLPIGWVIVIAALIVVAAVVVDRILDVR